MDLIHLYSKETDGKRKKRREKTKGGKRGKWPTNTSLQRGKVETGGRGKKKTYWFHGGEKKEKTLKNNKEQAIDPLRENKKGRGRKGKGREGKRPKPYFSLKKKEE